MATMRMADEEAGAWSYKGEGAANIVLEYIGANPALVGKVLRLRKTLRDHKIKNTISEKAPVLINIEQSIWADWPDVASATTTEILQHAYVKDVMLPLLGKEYVDTGVPVAISQNFLAAVAQNIQEKRPIWRQENADVDLLSPLALLISDHTKFSILPGVREKVQSTIAVEIKPKCGFLPTTTTMDPANVVKKDVSRFAMHQHLKYMEGKLKSISSYSPLDLFSGTSEGIYHAIESLFRTPQNNLRVFIDGTKLFSGVGEGAKAEVECMRDDEGVLQIIEDSLEGFIPLPLGERFKTLQALITELLYRSDMLNRLLAVQKLDNYDIEGAIHIYYDILETKCNVCLSSSQLSGKRVDDVASMTFVKGEQLTVNSSLHNDMKNQQTEAVAQLHSLSVEEKKKIIRDFLIAATAKDCSIILALQPVSSFTDERSIICCPVTKQQYFYKMFFLDLDLKRLKKLPFYHELDQKIVSYYAHSQASRTISS
ncbi:hypothetical protein O6H91_18G039100 [Diphasiastrum complanatum]|uniref:Uncharacterized protein n=2 Tax=Diphasiastrum complanatum TaxID=34168 RepID=A0ACC2B025_DIPCM|nr:hypothetical protein O6H91_18G039100 [Diphasiastrum complanatum]KAJ7523134.1 hypothetical protein O6H91_18G039100 [Diphasiastrum complanatum]